MHNNRFFAIQTGNPVSYTHLVAEVIYAGENNYDFISKKPCPTYELDSLMSDDIPTKVSTALRSWFISEYAYLDDWYNVLWEHSTAILLEPYIIKSEYIDESSLTVYCSSAISSYALFEDKDEQLYLAQGYDTVGLFSISFEIYNQSDWFVTSVHCAENSDEELYPGAGAVSYTHLDVYKRQSPFPCREIRGSTSTISRSPRIRPTIPMQL